jgi:hypothetical protein
VVAGNDDELTTVIPEESSCEVVKKFLSDAILISHHAVPVGMTDGCPLNDISAHNNCVRRRDDRRLSEISISISQQCRNERVIIDWLVA